MNTNEQDFWAALEDDDAVLVVDNDMCYVRYADDEEREGQSFDFNPDELVFMFAEKLEIEAKKC